ncbi:DMT family transporter [Pseudaminobacter salicylatoxidans]|uniref:DMT family transporter n=1 Tax=Pseudaminobacter salicylatoxidans TaxID=93369 RepID=UPI00031D6337|nr:DMT family transporter [Pseudaminobacter salicylatoxidans]
MPALKRFLPASFVILWSTGFIGARYAMPWAEPFTFLAVRFALAATLLALLIMLMRARRVGPHIALHSTIAGALMHGVYLGAVFWAIHRGLPAGIAALIAGLQPLVTALVAGRVLGEDVQPRHWAGLATGFAGVVVVLSPQLGTIGSGVTWQTLTAAVIGMAGMTAGTIWQKRFVTGSDLVTGTLYQYLGGAVLMTLASFALETHTVTINGELIFAMAWLVLVLSIGAIFLLMVMIRDGEMSKVSSLFYLVPVVTAIMAWALFGEHLTPVQIAGMVLATLGVGLATAQAPTRARASR